MWRYFHDMSRVLREATRVLKDGRHAVLVVCPSNIRKVPVATQELFVELAEHQALVGAQRPTRHEDLRVGDHAHIVATVLLGTRGAVSGSPASSSVP